MVSVAGFSNGPAGRAELDATSAGGGAGPIPMDEIADAVVRLVRDDRAAGSVTVIPDARR